MERTGMSRMSAQVQRKKWRYIGHILRKGPEDDCATALTWAPEGKRKRGRPKTTWRRNVEKERRSRNEDLEASKDNSHEQGRVES